MESGLTEPLGSFSRLALAISGSSPPPNRSYRSFSFALTYGIPTCDPDGSWSENRITSQRGYVEAHKVDEEVHGREAREKRREKNVR